MDKLPKHIRDKINVTDSCWLWEGHIQNSYGNANYMGKTERAHRVVYTIIKGKIPNGLVIDHLCRIKHCVNPDHLEAVTQKENILRGTSPQAMYAKRTHCDKGHEFDKDNTIIREENNSRRCKICHSNYHKLYREAHREALKEYQRSLRRNRKEYMRGYREKNRKTSRLMAEN